MSPANRFSFSLAAYAAAAMLCNIPMSASAINDSAYIEQSLIAQGAQITHHRLTGQTNFIGTRAGKAIALPGTGTAQSASAASMDALKAYGTAFGLRNPANELSQKSFKTITNGRSVIRYQQNYNGIPVIGGEMIVNLNANNGLLSINGEVSPKLAIHTKAKITAQQASNAALAAVAKWYQTPASTLTATTPVLSIYDPQLIGPNTTPPSLVWRIEVSSTNQQPIRELILLDAQRGSINLHFNQIDTALQLSTHDTAGTANLPGPPAVCTEADLACTGGSTDAQSAHSFAADTYNFYSTTHGRDGIDNAGSVIISTVNWDDGSSCPNAYWNGSQMVYCANMVVDDVVAHELTHGVTDNESKLFYYYQSGAISESLSDVWGEFVDLGNGLGTDDAASRWLLGEDLSGGAIRSMKNPAATPYFDPDKMSSVYYDEDVDFLDNGGVHTNSGISNKAAYLMVDGSVAETGGAFNGQTVTGIGITKTAKIYYEAQTNLLTSGSDYLDLYNALYQGCQNLIGTDSITADDCTQVRAATNAVEMNAGRSSNFNLEASVCPTGETVITTVFSDSMESGLSNWTRTNTGGTNWTAWTSSYGGTMGPYAASGTESLFADNLNTTSDQRAAISVAIPSGNPYLYFKHSFALEAGYDGGIVEYSTNGGSTWTNAGPLIDAGQTYNGTIDSTFGNPLGDVAAFTDISQVYVSTRIRLGNFQGKTVQFRWRLGTDSSTTYFGWWLDDVGVYNCTGTAIVDSGGGGGGGIFSWLFLLFGLLLLPLRRRPQLTI